METLTQEEIVRAFLVPVLLQVITLNIRSSARDDSGDHAWSARRGGMANFINDRQPDIHSLLYYCRKEDERHEEISSDLLGCVLPIPESGQNDLLTSLYTFARIVDRW